MDFKVKKVVGLHVSSRKEISILPWNGGFAYVACVGSGAALVPISSEASSHSQQVFYNYPPSSGNNNSTKGNNIGSPQGAITDSPSSPGSKLARVNKSSCVDSSSQSNLVAVGEHGGHMPRVLLFDLKSGECLDFVRDQHQFGVHTVRFSPSGKFLVSLGTPQDGYIYLYDVEGGKLKLRASNKCISEVNDLVWINDSQFITLGLRHIKVWNVDDEESLLSGRNVVLGAVANENFECALPLKVGQQTCFLVGTSGGGLFAMPQVQQLMMDHARPIKALAIAHNSSVYVSAGNQIRVFDFSGFDSFTKSPSMVYTGDSSALISCNSHVYSLENTKGMSSITELSEVGQKLSRNQPRFIEKKGLKMRGKGLQPTICWNGEDSEVLIWAEQQPLEIPLSDITVADSRSQDIDDSLPHIVVGSLSGDVWIDNKVYRAHNGPITDVQLFTSSLAMTSGRDRSVQLWVREESNWLLKQTLLFSTPILKARLVQSDDEEGIALVCCGVNKTVYTYLAKRPENLSDTNIPLFSDSPRSFLLKAMVFDLSEVGSTVVISTNDKMVTVVDPWKEEKVTTSWRPMDTNGDSVNLTHIQAINYEGEVLLLGSSSNKSVLLFVLNNGCLLASQWGFGEPISGVAWTGSKLIAAADMLIECELIKKATVIDTTAKVSDTRRNASSSLTQQGGLPKLFLPNSSPQSSRSSSPVRKVFDTGSPSRSRSVSPTRGVQGLRLSQSPRRSPSPPPRAHTQSTVQDRGRPTGASAAGSVVAPSQAPKLSYKPLRLSCDSLPQSQPTRGATTDSGPVQQLVSSLENFLAQADKVTNSESQQIRPLLMASLKKIDGLDIFDQYAERISKQLREDVKSQIAECFKSMDHQH